VIEKEDQVFDVMPMSIRPDPRPVARAFGQIESDASEAIDEPGHWSDERNRTVRQPVNE
jgi:hypothetical protein